MLLIFLRSSFVRKSSMPLSSADYFLPKYDSTRACMALIQSVSELTILQ